MGLRYEIEEGEKRCKLFIVLPSGEKLFKSAHKSKVDAEETAKKILGLNPSSPQRTDNAPEREEFEERTKRGVAELAGELRMNDEDRRRLAIRDAVTRSKPEQTSLTEPPMGGTVVAQSLAPQLGSDAVTLKTGQVDMRRFSKIEKTQLMPLAYLSWRGKKVRFWKHFVEQFENRAVAIDGYRSRQLIQMESAATGKPVVEELEKPGWVGRNITHRGWREDEKRRIEGLE